MHGLLHSLREEEGKKKKKKEEEKEKRRPSPHSSPKRKLGHLRIPRA